jgi:uncharacterized membrane protein
MKKNHAIIAGIAVVIAMCAGTVYGVRAGNAAVPIIAFLAGVFLLFYLKNHVDSVIEDEWTRLVEQKATSMALNTTAVLFTLIGLFLATVSSEGRNYDQAVYAIAAFLIFQAIAQVAFTLYYTRTLRGSGRGTGQ